MSSALHNISPSDRELLRSVLDEAGFGDVDDPIFFETATLLVTKLFLAGVDSRPELVAKLEYQLGKAGKHRQPPGSRLGRYAIQGLPLELQRFTR
ncbi:hypothetical protein PYH37_002031 [Sinorhizobium numidicum]|uniref:Transposase n=1 Tax=Sinorhizobium numidicum TaxID=680248 RepID=A0ABY8CRP8_9HYPH|nr:hypothetical protein [Sinorhizobium numidicum]WEX74587.1 hypothetical protein PYH37_002031 [Sinorhizobium numidicum]WEX80577.1 hypothetical protein PYH38_002033 [Sinorhizobium numidicum]